MRVRLLLFLPMLLVLACGRDEETLHPLGQKYAFSTIEFGDVKGYVKGRELSRDEITKFIARDPYLTLDPYNYRKPDTIGFLPDKAVRYKEPYDIFSWFYTRSGNRLQLSTDTLEGTGSCTGIHSCTMMEGLRLWKTDSIGSYIISSMLFKKIRYHKEYTLQGDNLIVPLIVFRYVYWHNPSMPGYGASVYQENKFDRNVLNKLIAGDTLAIRECKLIFKRVE